jgi:imidazole glycerol phosphate synthase glutamine amidotransferase subunit
VQNTLEAVGAQFEIVQDSAGLKRGEKILLPGVGNFGQMMRALDRMHVREVLRERIASGTPVLGICLGLQALSKAAPRRRMRKDWASFAGSVERFPAGARIPHMGWNTVQPVKPSRLLDGGCVPYVYFANSYYVPFRAQTAATCTYTAAFHGRARIRKHFRRAISSRKIWRSRAGNYPALRGAVATCSRSASSPAST